MLLQLPTLHVAARKTEHANVVAGIDNRSLRSRTTKPAMADVSGLIMTVLGISFQLTSTLFAYAKHVKDARGEIKQISNEAFALIGILQHIKMQDEIDISGQYAKKDSRQDMDRGVIRQVLQECLEFLQELHQKLMPSKGRLEARVQKLKWPFQASEVNEHLQRLERVKTYFMLALMTDEMCAFTFLFSRFRC